ncbi:MAG: DUF1890 domain-containing protein [Methanobrevibacter sp.]|jgi:hypothetical protein|nr:DUF1890 domain-containing protein [Candidatus Methanovirga australis]
MKKALILIGCPEAPSQTPLTLYSSYKLTQMGYDVTIAANPAAIKLLEVSDPENHYFHNKLNIEKALDNLTENSYDLLLGFVHKDAAASYFVTFYHILKTKSIALIFEKDADLLEDYVNIVSENTEAKMIVARVFHNPTPLKVKLDKALRDL